MREIKNLYNNVFFYPDEFMVFKSSDSNFLLFSGEIYNKEILSIDFPNENFSNLSDVEIFNYAWDRWGFDAFEKINGIFSIVIYDACTESVLLVRDRFGVIPLLWAEQFEKFIFSTSAQRLATHINAEIDTSYCVRGLRYKAYEIKGSGSAFKNVNAVNPASWLKIKFEKDQSHEHGEWYSLKNSVSKKAIELSSLTSKQLQKECFSLVENTIKIRLEADEPVSLTLSGGLDSSIIAAFSKRNIKDIVAFSYGSPDEHASEGPDVALLAKNIGIKVNYIWPTLSEQDLKELLLKTLKVQQAPFGGLSVLAQQQVFTEISKTPYKVILGGQGGDEIFAGYRKFFIVAIKEAVHKKQSIILLKLLCSLVRMLSAEVKQVHLYLQDLNRYKKDDNFSFEMINWQAPEINLWGQGKTLSERQIEDITYWSIPSLLRFEYRNASSNDIKTRLPFMDHRLVEFALALPSTMKISQGFGKSIMRTITKDIVPDHIRLNRKKRGFDVTQTWIQDGLGHALREIIISNITLVKDILIKDIHVESLLSDKALTASSNRLDEALMLAWIIQYKLNF